MGGVRASSCSPHLPLRPCLAKCTPAPVPLMLLSTFVSLRCWTLRALFGQSMVSHGAMELMRGHRCRWPGPLQLREEGGSAVVARPVSAGGRCESPAAGEHQGQSRAPPRRASGGSHQGLHTCRSCCGGCRYRRWRRGLTTSRRGGPVAPCSLKLFHAHPHQQRTEGHSQSLGRARISPTRGYTDLHTGSLVARSDGSCEMRKVIITTGPGGIGAGQCALRVDRTVPSLQLHALTCSCRLH